MIAIEQHRVHLQIISLEPKLFIMIFIHGPALKKFHDKKAKSRFKKNVTATIQSYGVTFVACANTMASQSIEHSDLLPNFKVAEKGGVDRSQ